MTRRALAFVAALALVLCVRAAHAHDETVSSSDVVVEARAVVWRVDVGVAGLAKALPLGPAPTEADLRAARPAIADYLARGLSVWLDGQQAVAEVGSLDPLYDNGAGPPGRVVVTLRFAAERPIRRLRCRVAFFADLTRQHRAVIVVRWGDRVLQLVRLGPSEIDLDGAAFAPSTFSVVREFVRWGMEHIFIGYDHIAFLLALLLVASGWGELFRIITSFTVAHSLTLLLSALNVVHIPSRVSEALIAASIVYVAAENLWRHGRSPDKRWALTFAFGLVHGLGFATELRQRLAALAGNVLIPVISFNVGVELGQVLIVAAVFPFLNALRRGPQRRRDLVVRWGSAIILVLGLGWLIERVVVL